VLSDTAELENLQVDFQNASAAAEPTEHDAGSLPAREDVRRQAVVWNEEQKFQLFRGLTCAVTAEFDLRRLVKTILHQAIQALGAERGILFLGRPDAAGLVPVLAVNIRGEELWTIERVSRTILAQGREGLLIVTPDAMADPRFRHVKSVKVNQMRSVICMPLVSSSGPLGALYLDAGFPDAFPDDSDRLIEAIAAVASTALENARVHGELIAENARLRGGELPVDRIWERLVGGSAAMERLRRQAALTAAMRAPVHILGEPGSGRRLLARAIHDAGSRAREAFIECDCTVFPGPLLRGLILGRRGAAARGSRAPEIGLAQRADRGTLYLTHAEGIDEDLAADLAGVLQDGLLRPIGGRRDEKVEVRLIVATGPHATGRIARNLPLVLAQRLTQIRLVLPPLRDRVEDIPALVAQFVRVDAPPAKTRRSISFTPEALDLLQAQPWPGNVLELRQVVRWIVLRGSAFKIEAEQVATALASAGRSPDAGPDASRNKLPTLRAVEEAAIRRALELTQGNKAEAARLLGIHRNTLILKAKSLGIPG
jgi:DNA-binding NtrC family response regulator